MTPINAPTIYPKAYVIGGGIAGLAAAAFLIRDGGLPGHAVYLIEESSQLGGALDGFGGPDTPYVIRGGRMLTDEVYTATYDLFSTIPSLDMPDETVREDIRAFNANPAHQGHSRARLLKAGEKLDVSSLGLSKRDRRDLIKMMASSEKRLGNQRIVDFFAAEFFTTPFWYMWSSMFAFQPWHSLTECRRYALRFIQELPRIATLSGVRRTRFNQQDSLVQPLVAWLKQQGVVFMTARVTDLDFRHGQGGKSVSAIHMIRYNVQDTMMVGVDDLVFTTIGSMTAVSSLGSMTKPPVQGSADGDGSWQLWEALACRHNEFGRPAVFNSRVEESRWLSFTVTQTDPAFFDYMETFTGNPAGTGGLVTFTDSPWQMSIVLAHQPHFRNQPEGVRVFWGYALFVEAEGASVRKPMLACTGTDILNEIAYQLRLNEVMHQRLLDSSICIPCLMPYITSQFMPRTVGDRPPVIPPGTRNFAFLGQFCEISEDVVFTVEYSVRSAQIAVYGLMNVKKPLASIYHGIYDLKVMFRAFKMLLRSKVAHYSVKDS